MTKSRRQRQVYTISDTKFKLIVGEQKGQAEQGDTEPYYYVVLIFIVMI